MFTAGSAKEVFTNPILLSDRVVLPQDVGHTGTRPLMLFPQPLWHYPDASAEVPFEVLGIAVPATYDEWYTAAEIVDRVSEFGDESRLAAHDWWDEFVTVNQLHLLRLAEPVPEDKGSKPIGDSTACKAAEDGRRGKARKTKRGTHRGQKKRGMRRREMAKDGLPTEPNDGAGDKSNASDSGGSGDDRSGYTPTSCTTDSPIPTTPKEDEVASPPLAVEVTMPSGKELRAALGGCAMS